MSDSAADRTAEMYPTILPLVGSGFRCGCEAAAGKKVNLGDQLAMFGDRRSPKVVGELNGQHVKRVKFAGGFVWHSHCDEDELILAMKGRFKTEFRGRSVPTGGGGSREGPARLPTSNHERYADDGLRGSHMMKAKAARGRPPAVSDGLSAGGVP